MDDDVAEEAFAPVRGRRGTALDVGEEARELDEQRERQRDADHCDLARRRCTLYVRLVAPSTAEIAASRITARRSERPWYTSRCDVWSRPPW